VFDLDAILVSLGLHITYYAILNNVISVRVDVYSQVKLHALALC
jgi:hypothetical protein